jgi:hypothetical protein
VAYYKDIKILVYVKRGAYTVKQTERNVEKFNMLKVLMATAFRDVELNARHLSRGASFRWHEDHCALEIDMPSARWEQHYTEVKELQQAIFDLSGSEHEYCAEYTVVVPDDPRGCNHFRSAKVQNPLLGIEVKSKVNL